MDIPEIKITVSMANGDITLNWEASPAASYTVKASGSVAGPYEPVVEALKFDDGSGTFSTKADQAAGVFIIQAK